MRYNKLIRDNIPAIIEASGGRAEIATLNESEFRRALLQKLVEEASEAQNAAPEELATELADVLEVFDALCEAFNVSRDEVLKVQALRREERGSFARRLKLLSVQKHAEGSAEFWADEAKAALAEGDYLTARKLAAQGLEAHPQNEHLQKLVVIIAPPRARLVR